MGAKEDGCSVPMEMPLEGGEEMCKTLSQEEFGG
jgi:hypothetical protein